jgi:hypothetical protein
MEGSWPFHRVTKGLPKHRYANTRADHGRVHANGILIRPTISNHPRKREASRRADIHGTF